MRDDKNRLTNDAGDLPEKRSSIYSHCQIKGPDQTQREASAENEDFSAETHDGERSSSATAAGNARSAARVAVTLPEPSNCPAGRRLDAAPWLGVIICQYA